MSTSTQSIPRYQSITRGVRVTAQPQFVENSSQPELGVYCFAYTISIHNHGEQTIQLLERHWLVYSADVQHSEVVGPGVVGEQPILSPGESFKYTSGVEIVDPVGAMQGSYTFRPVDGKLQSTERFQVEIPRFELIYALGLN